MSMDQSSEPKKKGRLKYFFKGIGRFVKGHLLFCIVLVAGESKSVTSTKAFSLVRQMSLKCFTV